MVTKPKQLRPKQLRKIADLSPDKHNPNLHTERGTGMLEKSLREYGAGRSILVDRAGRVVAGNATLESAAAIGLDKIIVVPTSGDQLVVVQRIDLDLETDPKARELSIADNRVAQVDLDWNADALASFENIDLSKFFVDDELNRILSDSKTKTETVERETAMFGDQPKVTCPKCGHVFLVSAKAR